MDEPTTMGARIANWLRVASYRIRLWAGSGNCGGFDPWYSRLVDAKEVEIDRLKEEAGIQRSVMARMSQRNAELELENALKDALIDERDDVIDDLGERVRKLKARLADYRLGGDEESRHERP